MQLQIVAIGAVAGVVLTLLGLQPTGIMAVDAIILVTSCAYVTWCASTAPYWMLTMTATIGTALVPPGWRTIVGLSLVIVSAVIGAERRAQPIHQAAVFAGTLVLYGLIGNWYRFGWSTAIAITLITAMSVVGIQRRPHRDRQIAQGIVAVVGLFVVVSVGLAGFAGMRSAEALQRGTQNTRRGITSLRRSNFPAASANFDEAARNLSIVDDTLSQPWVQPARLVPIVSQYIHTAQAVSGPAATSLRSVSTNLSQIDVEQLKPTDGRIDLDSVRALETPLTDVQRSMTTLNDALDEEWSPWLPANSSQDLNNLSKTLDAQAASGETAIEAVRRLPDLLGGSGLRRYFLMFTTPAEARGQGGLMGNYAVITADDGQLAVTAFGRHTELNRAMNKEYVLERAPEDWLNRYGGYGFRSGEKGYVGNQSWSIIDLSAHFPNTAQVIDELYPESKGPEIDGVFSLDVYGVQALIDVLGPISLKGAPKLDGETTADYLLLDQYRGLADNDLTETNTTRIDMLSRVALTVTNRLFGGRPPDLIELGQAFAPLAAEGRVLGWSQNPDEEALFERINIDGRVLDEDALTDRDGTERPGIQVAVNNAGGSKIDNFLRRKFTAEGNQATLTFTNLAPTTGFPNYVIGSAPQVNLPKGTSRLLVTVYSTSPLTNFAIDGKPAIAGEISEGDRLAYDLSIEMASMTSATITFEIADPDPIFVYQPLVKSVDDPVDVDADGNVLATTPPIAQSVADEGDDDADPQEATEDTSISDALDTESTDPDSTDPDSTDPDSTDPDSTDPDSTGPAG